MGSGLYLRPLDGGDPHGLLSPSPGGGAVPRALRRISDGQWLENVGFVWSPEGSAFAWRALVLRTSAGEVDPIGIGRALEVLARVKGLDPSAGVTLCKAGLGWMVADAYSDRGLDGWFHYDDRDVPALASLTRPKDFPEALAALLAHLGVCEVVRG